MKLTFKIFSALVFGCSIFVLVCRADVKQSDDLEDEVKIETVPYSSPEVKCENGGTVYTAEHFDSNEQFNKKWVLSKAKKPDVSEDLAQYNGKWELLPLEKFPLKGDTGLVLVTESRHAAIAAKFDKPFTFDGKKKFIVQYVVTFQKTVDCGGAYIKLLTEGSLKDLSLFNDKTPYTVMFGPDKCGGVSKLHFIIRHKNPISGEIVEKHCTKLKVDEQMYKDQEPYLLKLIIEPNNDFAVYINNDLQYHGNLLDEDTFNPPINPPKEIVDETDAKPENWDDRAKIPDPDAVKPEDWDENEPAEITDPDATKPEGWLDDEPLTVPDKDVVKPQDWDDEMDGEWAPPLIDNPVCKTAPGCGVWTQPMISNPKFKGKWRPPMIDNPNFKGKWMPRKIANPNYYFDDTPLKSSPIGYIGFELWSLVNNMYFDDILVTDCENLSKKWTENTWSLKKKSIAAESGSYYKMFLEYTNNYPWLWGVYVLILAIIVGLVGTCCFRSRKNKDDFERDLSHKKTDDYQQNEDGGRDDADEDEAPFEETARGEDKYENEDETDPDERNSKPSDDEDEDDEEEDVAQVSQTNEVPAPSSPRKRRPRKD